MLDRAVRGFQDEPVQNLGRKPTLGAVDKHRSELQVPPDLHVVAVLALD